MYRRAAPWVGGALCVLVALSRSIQLLYLDQAYVEHLICNLADAHAYSLDMIKG